MKLFSTCNFVIPKKLIKTTRIDVAKTIFLFCSVKLDNILVTLEFSFVFKINIFFSLIIFIKLGSNVNVTNIDVIRPNVIIHPKSTTGLIPLNINDKNAQIVVNTVYNIGQNIFLVVY